MFRFGAQCYTIAQSFAPKTTSAGRIERLPEEGNARRSLPGEVRCGGFDADPLVVANRAHVREERRVVEFVPRLWKDASLGVRHVEMADVVLRLEDDRRVFAFDSEVI